MNRFLVIALVTVNLWQFLIVPYLSSPLWMLTLIPLALLNNTMWSLVHEAIHGNLAHNRTENLWCGRVLSALFGSSFTFLTAGHLSHHALNRTEHERLEIVKPGQSMWRARLTYYSMMCGGLFVTEVLVPLAFIIPFRELTKVVPAKGMARMILQRVSAKHVAVVIESVVAISLLVASFCLYGSYWPVLLAVLFARAFLVSSLEYIYHYGNELDNVNAAYNLALPRPLSALLLHFNWHHTHHVSPKTPWHQLELESLKRNECYDEYYWRAALRAWRGPIRQSP